MGGEVNRNVMIAVIAAAVLIAGGIGWMMLNRSAPTPPATYQPVMPPQGYGSQASGPSGMRQRMMGGPTGGAPTGNAPIGNGP